MRSKSFLLVFLLILTTFFISACDKGGKPEIPQIPKNYILKSTYTSGLDEYLFEFTLVKTVKAGVTPPPAVVTEADLLEPEKEPAPDADQIKSGNTEAAAFTYIGEYKIIKAKVTRKADNNPAPIIDTENADHKATVKSVFNVGANMLNPPLFGTIPIIYHLGFKFEFAPDSSVSVGDQEIFKVFNEINVELTVPFGTEIARIFKTAFKHIKATVVFDITPPNLDLTVDNLRPDAINGTWVLEELN